MSETPVLPAWHSSSQAKVWIHRVAASSLCCGLLGAATWVDHDVSQEGGQAARDRVAKIAPPEQAQAATLARQHRLLVTPVAFDEAAARDAQTFAVRNFAASSLRDRQPTERHITTPIVLAPGQRREFGPLQIKAEVMAIAFQKGGATLRAKHMILEVTNRSRRPQAYYTQVRMQGRGFCTARGSLRANAMALMPGEVAKLSVCAGTGNVEVSDLRSLAISELGYHYLTMLPPQAVGIDPIGSRAHGPSDRCSQVPASRLAAAQINGTLRWEDVVDFYSRHSCERFQMSADYRHVNDMLEILPYGASTEMQDAIDQMRESAQQFEEVPATNTAAQRP